MTRTLRVAEWNPRARLNEAAGFQFTNLSHLPQGGHPLLLRSDQSSLRADARRRIPDYFLTAQTKVIVHSDQFRSPLRPKAVPLWTVNVRVRSASKLVATDGCFD